MYGTKKTEGSARLSISTRLTTSGISLVPYSPVGSDTATSLSGPACADNAMIFELHGRGWIMPTHAKVGVTQNYESDDVSVAALFNSWA